MNPKVLPILLFFYFTWALAIQAQEKLLENQDTFAGDEYVEPPKASPKTISYELGFPLPLNLPYDSLTPSGYWKDGSWKPYASVKHFPSGKWVQLRFKQGYIKENGENLIPVAYDDLIVWEKGEGSFLDSLGKTCFQIRLGPGKFGMIDEDLKLVLPFKFDWIYTSGVGIIRGKAYRILSGGKLKPDPFRKDSITIFKEGATYGLKSSSGRILSSPVYKSIRYFEGYGMYLFWTTDGQKFVLDHRGDTLIAPMPKWRVSYAQSGKYWQGQGVFNAQIGEWIDADSASGFSLGFIDYDRLIENKRNNEGIYDFQLKNGKGEVIIPFGTYDNYQPNLMRKVILVEKESKQALIDAHGKLLIPLGAYDKLQFHNQFVLIENKGKHGAFHLRDRILLEPLWDKLLPHPHASSHDLQVWKGEKRKILKYQEGRIVEGQE